MSVAALLIIFGHRILMLFNPDPAVIHFGYIRATILLSTQALNVVNEVLSGAMRGYGISMVPAAVTFIGVCGTRILWVYTVFRHSHLVHPDGGISGELAHHHGGDDCGLLYFHKKNPHSAGDFRRREQLGGAAHRVNSHIKKGHPGKIPRMPFVSIHTG